MAEPSWLAGAAPPAPSRPPVKIASDVWLFGAADETVAVEASIVHGAYERVHLRPAASGPSRAALAAIRRALVGQPATLGAVDASLRPFGEPGRRVRDLLRPAVGLTRGA